MKSSGWAIAFKRRHCGRLIWVSVVTSDLQIASREAAQLIARRYPGQGYVEYGCYKERVE